jgi:hypothetical protein
MVTEAGPARYGVPEDGSAFQTGADFDCRWIADGLRVQRGESAALQPALRLDWDE